MQSVKNEREVARSLERIADSLEKLVKFKRIEMEESFPHRMKHPIENANVSKMEKNLKDDTGWGSAWKYPLPSVPIPYSDEPKE